MDRCTRPIASSAGRIRRLLVALPLFATAAAHAAEYSEADDLPAVISVEFTEESVALTVVRDWSGYGGTNRAEYFVADRDGSSFREISEQTFRALTPSDDSRGSTGDTRDPDIELTPSDDCEIKGYDDYSGSFDMTGRRILRLPSRTIEVEMLCQSAVSTVLSLDASVWIGTETVGDHGVYGSEGVLVVPINGDPVVRPDIGRGLVRHLVVDPWTSDVWITTPSQLFRVAEDTTVKARYSAYRDFDYDKRRPVVRIEASDEPIPNNPLAVLADWLGPPSHRALSEAGRNGVTLPGVEPLYHYAMFGNIMQHIPQWPEELAVVLEQRQPTFGWRKLACLLPGEEARTLCLSGLGEWPRTTNVHLQILEDRYPEFAITGPVHGPDGEEDLRKQRHSPQNFSDDVLFGDFDRNGIRDFAAVLIERGARIEGQLDAELIGFVAVCNGEWTPDRQVEYACVELTEREPGGFRVELDFVDWTPRAEALLKRPRKSGDRLCPYKLRSNPNDALTWRGTKKLSVMSSSGQCDSFFFHSDNEYKACQYCSD